MRLLMVLTLVFTLAVGTFAAEDGVIKEEKVFKTKIGLLDPLFSGGGDELKRAALEALRKSLVEIGGYEVYDQRFITESFENIQQRFPTNCMEPRCAAAIGTTVDVDRIIYGTIDKGEKSYGISLTLVDVASRRVIENVTLEGDPGVSLEDVITVTVNRLHGYVDENLDDKTHKYFGKQVNNKKEMLISSAGWVGVGLIWSLISGKSVDGTTLTNVDVLDSYSEDLSGIGTGADMLSLFGRPSAMGNAYIAASDDAYGVFFNPAGLSWVGSREMAFGYQYRFGMMNNFFASYVNKATREIGFGQGLLYSGDRDGLFSEMYFYTSISYKFNQLLSFLRPLSVGATVKLISKRTGNVASDSSSISGGAFGVGLDVGAQLELSDKIRGAILLKNLPTIINWNNASLGTSYRENEPVEFILGGSFQANYGTFIICEGRIPVYEDQMWGGAAGIEQNLFRVLNLRLGVEKRGVVNSQWKINGGFGFKVQFNEKLLNLDASYEYNTLRPFSNVLNFSFRFAF